MMKTSLPLALASKKYELSALVPPESRYTQPFTVSQLPVPSCSHSYTSFSPLVSCATRSSRLSKNTLVPSSDIQRCAHNSLLLPRKTADSRWVEVAEVTGSPVGLHDTHDTRPEPALYTNASKTPSFS